MMCEQVDSPLKVMWVSLDGREGRGGKLEGWGACGMGRRLLG